MGVIAVNSNRITVFVFSGLLLFGGVFSVFADDSSGHNIFQDSDQDGLSNAEEKLYGTDPFQRDTDGDGYSDGVEVQSGYDPLKKAPGDKIIKVQNAAAVETTHILNGRPSLTEQVSAEIANVLKGANNSEAITVDQVDASVQKVINGNVEVAQLPEVDRKDIKIKKGPSKKLGVKDRKEEERKDVLEYLTVISYIIANNSPKAFHTKTDLGNVLDSFSSESMAGIASGNTQYLNELSQKGEKILDEIKDIEVPEAMLDIHIKALRMALYASQLKNELQPNQNDPLGQIATLSKIQGIVGVASSFSDEIQKKLIDLNIQEIPITP